MKINWTQTHCDRLVVTDMHYFWTNEMLMERMIVPPGYNRVMPYIIVPDGAAFARFVLEVFGAVEIERHMRDERSIGHAEVRIGDTVIMFADALEEYPPTPASLFIYVADADATYAKALELGATVISPLSDRNYGRTGGVKDTTGNTWWITRHPF